MFKQIFDLARQNAPCYIYEKEVIRQHATTLQNAFPRYDILFSVKANPYPPVMKTLAAMGIGADAASAQEVLLAEACGMSYENIFFSAPGKTEYALETAWAHGCIVADSIGEIARIGALCRKKGEKREIGIRINPTFSMGGGQGGSSKFGINEEDLSELKLLLSDLPVCVVGIHVHLKSQNLDAACLGGYYRDSWSLAKRVKEQLGCEMKYVNFGSGLGIAYNEAVDQPMDFAQLRIYTDAIAVDNDATLKARLMIESGRFLTCHAGTYWLPVVDKKCSRGTTYVITECCMNGLQKPAIAAILRRIKPEGDLPALEPVFTSPWAFPIIAHGDENATEEVNIVGNLCTDQDVLVEHFVGPKLDIGDLIEVKNAGSYACTLTARQFSSHIPPKELLVDKDGRVLL